MRYLKCVLYALPILFCALAIFLIHKELMLISFQDLKFEISNWSKYKIELSLLLTFANFIVFVKLNSAEKV